MRDAHILTAEDPQAPGSPVPASNAENGTHASWPSNYQRAEAQSALAGATTATTAKPSPSVPESTVSNLPLCPADLSSAGHDGHHAVPQPSGVRSGPGTDQSPEIRIQTADPADKSLTVPLPPADLSPAHRQAATQLEPAPPDGRSATPESAGLNALQTGRAPGIAPEEPPAIPPGFIGQDHVSTVHKPPAPDVAMALPGTLVTSVDEPLLPVPLPQGDPVNGPVLPLAPAFPAQVPATDTSGPPQTSADAQQQRVPSSAGISNQLSPTTPPPQQPVSAPPASAAPLKNPPPAASAPGISQHWPGSSAPTPSTQLNEPGIPPRGPDHPSPKLSVDAADSRRPDQITSQSASSKAQQAGQASDSEQRPVVDAQGLLALLSPEGQNVPASLQVMLEKTMHSMEAAYQEWQAQEGNAGQPESAVSEDSAIKDCVGQDSVAKAYLRAIDPQFQRWANHHMDQCFQLASAAPMSSKSSPDVNQALLQIEHPQPHQPFRDLLDFASAFHKYAGSPVLGALSVASAQGQAGSYLAEPVHGKDAGNPRIVVPGYQTPALEQASKSPMDPLPSKDAGTCGDQAASDKAPAQGQACAASTKPEAVSSAGVTSKSGGSNPGTVEPVEKNKLGQARGPVKSAVVKPAGPSARRQPTPEGTGRPPASH